MEPPGPPEPNNDQDNMFFAAHVDKTIKQATKRRASAMPAESISEHEASVQGWISRNGKLELKNGALVLTPDAERTGKSRAFITHSQLDLPGPVTATLKLRAITAADRRASITWRTKAESFAPHQSAAFDWPADTDWQEVRVSLPEKSRIIHLRIMPPVGATWLEIQSIDLQSDRGEPQVFRFDKH